MNYYKEVLKKYAVFSGRAKRAEYWYFVLFNAIISIAVSILSMIIRDKMEILPKLYSLAVIIPGLAVASRRLHDIGKKAWWLLIGLIPLIGQIWLIILFAKDGNPGDNQYGANPKGTVAN